MRAAAQAHPSEVSASTARQALVRLLVALGATLMLLALWPPKVVHAQQAHPVAAPPHAQVAPAPSQTPKPKSAAKGGTLAAQTVDKSDAPAAPASASPRVVRAGAPSPAKRTSAASSKGSAKGSAKASASAPQATVVAADSAGKPAQDKSAESATVFSRASVAAALDSARTGRRQRTDSLLAPRTATHIGLVDPEELRAARSTKEVATVFLRHVPDQAEVEAQARAISRTDAPAPRRGEYEGAPFSIESASLLRSGRLLRRIGAPSGTMFNDPQHLLLADEVEIAAPAGVAVAVGDRLVSVHVHEVTKGVNVAVPTGILRVTRVERGKTIVATLQAQTGGVQQGQALLVIEGSAAPLSARATSTSGSELETTVRWIDGTESLPTLQSYVMFAAGRAQGVQPGDEFDLHTARTAGGGGEERIARARVVRVGAAESTAIIVKQERAEIAIGVQARRIARVP